MQVHLTIGWTIHEERHPTYVPFIDNWKPGQPQVSHSLEVEVPDNWTPWEVAEACFAATNAPFVVTGPAAAIAEAIGALGYHGEGAHYSLSVGDTVEVDGVLLACSALGWHEVEKVQ